MVSIVALVAVVDAAFGVVAHPDSMTNVMQSTLTFVLHGRALKFSPCLPLRAVIELALTGPKEHFVGKSSLRAHRNRAGLAALAIVGTCVLSACGGGSSGGNSSPTSSTSSTYSLSATFRSLTSSGLVLTVNGASVPVPSGSASVTLASGLASGKSYTVSVGTQPSGQSCAVQNGTGTVGSANVTSVIVACAYTVSGTISGLGTHSGLVLLDNGGDATTIAANSTSFTMNAALSNGASYAITVQSDPAGMLCLPKNGSGTINGAGVTNIALSCGTPAETVLYSFSGGTSDGEYPMGTPIQATDGNFYGATFMGGSTFTSNGGDGVIFQYDPTTKTETVVHSFTGGADGQDPEGGVIQAKDGNLYGLTCSGGTSDLGTLYEYDPTTKTESVLYSFKGGTDGACPKGELIQATNGDFYGITSTGGTASVGTIFQYDPTTGTETVLHSFAGGTTDGDESVAYGGHLIQASDGNLYGLAGFGGAQNYGVIFEYDLTTNTESVLYSFKGGTDGAVAIGSLLQGSNGNFYGLTTNGGDASCTMSGMIAGCGTVFEYDPATKAESVLYAFTGGPDGRYPNDSLIQASDGNFYGITGNGGTSSACTGGCGTLFEYNPTIKTETVLYSFGGQPDGSFSDGNGNLLQAADGNFYGFTTGGGTNGYGTIFELYLK